MLLHRPHVSLHGMEAAPLPACALPLLGEQYTLQGVRRDAMLERTVSQWQA